MIDQNLLLGIKLFSGLSEADLRKVSERCRWRSCARGEEVVSHRDTDRDVYFVILGKVRVKVFSLEGKEVSYRDISAGEIFGEFAAIDGRPRSANVSALSDCRIAVMSPEALWQTLEEFPSVNAALLCHLTEMIRQYSDRIFEFSTLAVRNRIHAELLRLARPSEKPDNTAIVDPAPTHEEIASRISTHREAVTRELNALRRAGVIARKGSALHILDIERLSKLVEEVAG